MSIVGGASAHFGRTLDERVLGHAPAPEVRPRITSPRMVVREVYFGVFHGEPFEKFKEARA